MKVTICPVTDEEFGGKETPIGRIGTVLTMEVQGQSYGHAKLSKVEAFTYCNIANGDLNIAVRYQFSTSLLGLSMLKIYIY